MVTVAAWETEGLGGHLFDDGVLIVVVIPMDCGCGRKREGGVSWEVRGCHILSQAASRSSS